MACLIFLVLGYAALRIARAYLLERSSIVGRRTQLDLPHEQLAFPLLEAVAFQVEERNVKGWLTPGKNGAAVLLIHGTGSDRTSVREEMRLLSRAGFTVLSFDQPGHGESEGSVSFRGVNRAAIHAAVRFLEERPEVTSGCVGALGLSYGGYDLIHAAPLTRLAAIAVAGAPSDLMTHSRSEYPRFLDRMGALWAMREYGVPLDEPSAASVVDRLSPRPLLVMWGAQDSAVARAIAVPLFERAHEPKTWLELPHAGHGGYAESDGELYESALVGFFRQALGRTCGTSP